MQPSDNDQTITPTYRVYFNRYASIGKNIVPKPGLLSIDGSGTLLLIDTTTQQVVVERSLSLVSIRPTEVFHFFAFARMTTAHFGLLLYVGRNEAYKIIFTSDTSKVERNAHRVLEDLFTGNTKDGVENLKAIYENSKSAERGDSITVGTDLANRDYAHVIEIAKNAGVYRSPLTSPLRIANSLVCVILLVALVCLFYFILHGNIR